MRMWQRLTILSAVTTASLLLGARPALAQPVNALGHSHLSMYLGVFEPQGDSDLWDFNEEFTTQDVVDFDDFIGGISFGVPLGRFADMDFGTAFYDGHSDVVYRDIFTIDGDKIHQEHRLQLMPFEVSFKLLPLPRASGGRLHPLIPYFGGGGGILLWRYREEGLFVDDIEDPVFVSADDRETRGVTPTLHALAGMEIQFAPEAAMFFEGRYRWAEDDLGSDFDSAFDDFDLSGFSLTAGFTWRFGVPRRQPALDEEFD